MKPITRIEHALAAAIATGEAEGAPPKLAGASRHAVFPGGARIRPQPCLAVAQACARDDPGLPGAVPHAIELPPSASPVPQTLPRFARPAPPGHVRGAGRSGHFVARGACGRR